MRKILPALAVFAALLLPAAAQATSRMTHCLWLSQDGHYCSALALRHNLFDLPTGRTIGCKSSPGKVDSRGILGRHPQVALTFDDGPSIYTASFLKVLKQYHVPATFFLIGEQVYAKRNLVRQELAAGHILGSHSWNHPMLSRTKNLHAQFVDSQTALKAATGYTPCFMRPPYGDWNLAVQAEASKNKLEIINWDVDTRDWSRPGTNSIVRQALTNARNGSIILMHDGGGNRLQTLAALPQIIKGLRRQGFKLVRVDKILNIKMRHQGLGAVR